MQDPVLVHIFQSLQGHEDVRFDVGWSQNQAGVFDDHLAL